MDELCLSAPIPIDTLPILSVSTVKVSTYSPSVTTVLFFFLNIGVKAVRIRLTLSSVISSVLFPLWFIDFLINFFISSLGGSFFFVYSSSPNFSTLPSQSRCSNSSNSLSKPSSIVFVLIRNEYSFKRDDTSPLTDSYVVDLITSIV